MDGRAGGSAAARMRCASISMRGGNKLFLVVPPEPLRAGREYEFEFQHSGKVIHDAGDHVYYVTARGNWYPTHGVQFASTTWYSAIRADLDLVAAGDVVEDRTEGESAHHPPPHCLGHSLRGIQPGQLRACPAGTRRVRGGRVRQPHARSARSSRAPPSPSSPRRPHRCSGAASRICMEPAVPAGPKLLHQACRRWPRKWLRRWSSWRPGSVRRRCRTSRFRRFPARLARDFPGLIYLSTLAYLKNLPGRRARPPPRRSSSSSRNCCRRTKWRTSGGATASPGVLPRRMAHGGAGQLLRAAVHGEAQGRAFRRADAGWLPRRCWRRAPTARLWTPPAPSCRPAPRKLAGAARLAHHHLRQRASG